MLRIKVTGAVIVAAAGISAGSAHAADLFGGDPAPVLRSALTWTGPYVGAIVGFGSTEFDADTIGTSAFQTLIPGSIVPDDLDTSDDGVLGGVTAGYNYQFGSAIFGVEADVALTDFDGDDSFTGNPVLGTQLRTEASVDLDYLATVRARAGFAFERAMFFATGGLAFGGVNLDASVTGVQAPGLVWSGSESTTEFGWTAGAGAEVKLTDQVSVKLDGLYFDLADTDTTATGNAAVRGIAALDGIDYSVESENTGFVGRLGVNFSF
ncbi:MAG: outer membrane beta-barrel protein [Pseudomonadota bacterium]